MSATQIFLLWHLILSLSVSNPLTGALSSHDHLGAVFCQSKESAQVQWDFFPLNIKNLKQNDSLHFADRHMMSEPEKINQTESSTDDLTHDPDASVERQHS